MRLLGRRAAADEQQAEIHKKKKTNEEELRGRSRTPKEEGQGRHSSSSGGKQKKSRSRSGERSASASASSHGRKRMPVIDRIPTAVGYQSDDSEDEWLEQKSKCSRYSGRYDPAEFPLSDDEEKRDEAPAALTGEDGDAEAESEAEDRYAPVKKTKPKASSSKQSSKNKKQAAQVERLWSDGSFETMQFLLRDGMQQKIISRKSSGSRDKYSKEGDVDPIYDSPKKKKSNGGRDDSSKKSRGTAESKAKSRSSSKKKEQRSESRSKPRSKSPRSPRSPTKSSSPRSTRSRSSRSTTRSRSKSVSKKRSSSAKARGRTSNSHSSRDRARGRSLSRGRDRSSGRSHSSRSTKRSNKSHSSRERRRSRRPGSTRSHSSRSKRSNKSHSSRERRRSRRPGSTRSHSSRSTKQSNRSSSRERHRSRSARSRSSRSTKQSSKSPRSDRYHRSRTKAKEPSKKARSSSNKQARSKRREKPLEVVSPLEEVVTPQDSPAVGSETSSLTDPLHAALNYSTTDKVVKEIEQKLKLLKKAAAEEKAAAKRARKEAKKKELSSKSEVATKESESKKKDDSKSKKKLVGKKIPVEEMEQEPASPKDAVEMMRSESNSTEHEPDTAVPKVEKPKKKKKADKITSKNENEVEVQEELVTVEGTMDGQGKGSSVPKLESQLTEKSVNSSGRPFSKLFSKTKISVGAAAGNGTATESGAKGRRREGGNWDSMYTKALFTPEDSTLAASTPLYSATAAPIPLSQPQDQAMPLSGKSEMQRCMLSQSMPTEDGGKHKKSNAWKFAWTKHEKKKIAAKTKDLVTKAAPAWKFGRKKPTAVTSGSLKSIKMVKSSSFWKKRKAKDRILKESDYAPRRRRLQPKKKSAPSSVELNSIKADDDHQDRDALQRLEALISQTKKNSVAELDEYSVTEGVSDEPALVQCLKFYSCGTIADKVNVAIKAANCQGCHGASSEAMDADVDDDGSGHFVPATPQPAVEVVLDDLLLQHEQTSESKSKGSSHKSGSIQGRSILSCGDNNSWEEALGKVPSILIDVTDKQLHLDEDVSLDQEKPVLQQEAPLAMKRVDLSITSVRVPKLKSKKAEKMQPAKTKRQKKKSEKTLVHQGLDKSKPTDGEEAVTEYNSSSHDNDMEEESAFLSEEEVEMKVAPHGRFRKLVRCFRKK